MTIMKTAKTLIFLYLFVFSFIISSYIDGLATTRKIPDKSEIPTLIKMTKSENEEIRLDAAYKLGRINKRDLSDNIVKTLIDLLNDSNKDVVIESIMALGLLEINESIPFLTGKLNDKNAQIIEFSAQSIGLIGTDSKRTIKKLISLLNHDSSSTRLISAFALARIGKGADYAIPVLVRSLKSNYLREQLESIKVIELFGSKAALAVKPLIELLQSPNQYIRKATCRALIAIGSKKALKALENHNEDCDTRWMGFRKHLKGVEIGPAET